jgi:hypothetical protein
MFSRYFCAQQADQSKTSAQNYVLFIILFSAHKSIAQQQQQQQQQL